MCQWVCESAYICMNVYLYVSECLGMNMLIVCIFE